MHSADSTDASSVQEPIVDESADASSHPATHPPHSRDGGHQRNQADGGVLSQDALSAESINGDAGTAPDGGVAYSGPTMTAMWVWVPVFERMEWDGPKVGYLRAGAQVPLVSAQSTGNGSGCPRGWYAVEGGGYLGGACDVARLPGDVRAVRLSAIENADGMASLYELIDNVAANESGATGYCDVHADTPAGSSWAMLSMT